MPEKGKGGEVEVGGGGGGLNEGLEDKRGAFKREDTRLDWKGKL